MPSPEEQVAELLAALEEGGSSTTFELTAVRVGDGGRLEFDGAATSFDGSAGARRPLPPQRLLPGSSSSSSSSSSSNGGDDDSAAAVPSSRFDFTMRAAVAALDEDRFLDPEAAAGPGASGSREAPNEDAARPRFLLRPGPPDGDAKDSKKADRKRQKKPKTKRAKGCGLMITDAELRASFGASSFLGVNIQIPDVWVPVVSPGLAVKFGSRHRVTAVETSRDADDQLDICGAIYFTEDAPPDADGGGWFGAATSRRKRQQEAKLLLPPPPRTVAPRGPSTTTGDER